MKRIILLILLCGTGRSYAQYISGNNTKSNNRPAPVTAPAENVYDQRIHLTDSIQEITADILPVKNNPKIKNDRYYYWYLNKVIHSTQGGYTGQLLNGHYTAFYTDKNLKEDGNFKTGLKDGVWKTWDQKGNLSGVTNWDEGIEVPVDQSIWKKIPFLNKKDAQATPAKN